MLEYIFNLPVLFFVFGVLAVLLNSNLSVSKSFVESLTLYLMIAIGLKGGIALASSPIVIAPIIWIIVGSLIVATYMFFIAKRFCSRETAAGIAATYGSNSTMTFVTAIALIEALNIPYGGYMTVALVLMETPAIIYGIYLANKNYNSFSSLKQALLDGTHLLLIASLIIGFLTVNFTNNSQVIYGFIGGDIFTGALCLFLLSMGLKVGSALKESRRSSLNVPLISIAIILPWINGALGYIGGLIIGLSSGDLFLTTILMASASYIVAPAILESAVPKAEISKYLTMSIAITFPMNLLIALPLWANFIL